MTWKLVLLDKTLIALYLESIEIILSVIPVTKDPWSADNPDAFIGATSILGFEDVVESVLIEDFSAVVLVK